MNSDPYDDDDIYDDCDRSKVGLRPVLFEATSEMQGKNLLWIRGVFLALTV